MGNPVTLRDYQTEAIEALRTQIRAGVRRLLLLSGTGTGKTVCAAAIISGARRRDKRILFLAHRRELIEQTSRKLDAIGVDHGICQASHWRTRPWLPVQVASIQTLINRELPFAPDLIICDEAHRIRGNSWQEVIGRYPSAVLLGLTATPIRSDGKGLGTMFDVMVQCPSVRAMIDRGFLVPIRAWTQPEQSFKGVRKTAGDYNLEDLAVRMDQAKLIGNIVRHWKKLADGRQSVVFAVNVEHSKHICAEFRAGGIAAEHLDGTTPTNERDAILDRLATGRTRVVTNCQVLSEGWDCPPVSCIVLARPTLSAGLYLQMAGRALRPSDGKQDCIILDHAGCVRQHGLVDEEREWTLTADRIFTKKSVSTADTIQVCPKCMAVAALSVLVCPECGYVFARRKPREIKEEDGDLVEATPEVVSEGQMRQRRRQYEFFLHQQEYGARKDGGKFKRGYAEARYRGQYGQWPPANWRNEWKAREKQEGVA